MLSPFLGFAGSSWRQIRWESNMSAPLLPYEILSSVPHHSCIWRKIKRLAQSFLDHSPAAYYLWLSGRRTLKVTTASTLAQQLWSVSSAPVRANCLYPLKNLLLQKKKQQKNVFALTAKPSSFRLPLCFLFSTGKCTDFHLIETLLTYTISIASYPSLLAH